MKKYIYFKKFVLIALTVTSLCFLYHVNIAAQGGFKGYQVIRYEGEALNTTYNRKAKVQLKILSIDQTGNVSARFGVETSDNLIGDGTLTGNIDENGILRLSGPFASWQIAIAGQIDGETINANYKLTGPNTQEGHFTVKISPEQESQPVTSPQTSSSCVSGRYEGTAINTTYNQTGKVVLEIQKSADNGNLSAHFTASNGLSGDGILTGNINSGGIMQLSGNISSLMMQIAARISGDTINANYILSSGGSSQKGSFTVKCVETQGANFPQTPRYNNTTNNPNVYAPQRNPANNSVSNNSNNVQPVEPNQNFGSGDSINGAWKGTYTCLQGLTNAVLSVYTKDGVNVDGIFTFLLGDGPNMTLLGSGKYKGTYNSQTGKIDLKGVDWDEKPSGYYLWELSGTVSMPTRKMSGNVIGQGCTTFQFEKIKF